MKTKLQTTLEDNPQEASGYTCGKCCQRIGDTEYVVDSVGIVSHGNCLMAALRLIKIHIEPRTDSGRDIHSAVQIIVTIARENGWLAG